MWTGVGSVTGERIGERGTWWGEEKGNLWAENGLVALPPAATRAEAEASVARHETGGEYWCDGCKEWHETPFHWKWWAGLYCEDATAIVKANNSRACGICRRPLWDCSC